MLSLLGSTRRLRVAVALVLCSSVIALVLLVAMNPGTFWRQTDAVVYRDAGRFVWSDHGRLYASTFGPVHLPFTYTPFAAALFSLGRHVPFAGWQIVLAIGDVVCLLSAVTGALKIAATATDRFRRCSLAVAMCIWLEPVDLTFHFGQINLWLLALIVLDLSGTSRAPWRGLGLGVAAGVKLTPLIFIPYLWLIGRRREAYGALGFFGLTIGIGYALLPRDSGSFWSGRLLRPGDGPTRLQDQSVHGFIQRLSPDGAAMPVLWVTLSIIVGIVGMAIAVRAARAGLPLTGVATCAATGLAVSPLSWTHHYAYIVLVVVLVFSSELPAHVRAVLGSVMFALFAWWPLPNSGAWSNLEFHTSGFLRLVPHGSGQEMHWSVVQTFVGNYYLWCIGLFLISAARWTNMRRRKDTAPGASLRPGTAAGSVGVPIRP